MPADDIDPPAIRVGVLCGSDESSQIDWQRKAVILFPGNNDATKLMRDCGVAWRRLDLCPSYFRKSERWDTRGLDLLFNTISDPDRHPKTLDVAEKLIGQTRLPALNPPAAVRRSSRDGMAQRLQGIPDVHVPRVVRVRNPTADRLAMRMSGAGMSFPAIVRPVGRQTGRGVILCRRIEDAAPIFGDRENEYYVTEFVDFASPDGLYRKYRFIAIGQRLIPRHLLIGPDWSIHAKIRESYMAARPELEAEFDGFLRDGLDGLPARARIGLEGIRARAGLDYFGIDCHVTPQGGIVVFEANATMTFWRSVMKPDFRRREEVLMPARAALAELLQKHAKIAA